MFEGYLDGLNTNWSGRAILSAPAMETSLRGHDWKVKHRSDTRPTRFEGMESMMRGVVMKSRMKSKKSPFDFQ